MKDFIAKWIVVVVVSALVGALAGLVDWNLAEKRQFFILFENCRDSQYYQPEFLPNIGDTVSCSWWDGWGGELKDGRMHQHDVVIGFEEAFRSGMIGRHRSVADAAENGAFLFGLNVLWIFPILALIWWSFRRVVSRRDDNNDDREV